ncbi:unnamed protein product [Auanema sp. JU1783]|nr:unnamed protein product [Auanema sp. JU1783]
MDIELETKGNEKDTVVYYHDNFENYTGHVLRVASAIRANFLSPSHWSIGKIMNASIASVTFVLAIYSLAFSIKTTLEEKHSPYEMASQLMIIAWAIQAIVSMAFFVYWQLFGHLHSYNRHVMGCQHGAGLAHGSYLIKSNILWFYLILVLEVSVILLFEVKFYAESSHSEFVEKRAHMFYFKELRLINTVVTLYTYLTWHISMFLYIMYTNTAFIEIRYFNQQVSELDGSSPNVENELIRKLEVYGRLAGVVRELDRIFRLYAFIMLLVIIPSVIFTLMMMNQRIHSFQDLILCLPSIALCAYSFLGITIAPARLHDEINRSRSCLFTNQSIWFPYRKDIYQVATTLCQHMEQYDLGISIWGFAIVSRPFILATFSVMAMVLSLLIELSPHPTLLHDTHNVTKL